MISEYKLVADTSPFCSALEELEELFKHTPKFPREFVDRILCLLETPSELIAIKNKPAPVGTLALSLEPSDFLLNLLVAVRAGDFNSLALHIERHNRPPLISRHILGKERTNVKSPTKCK